MDFPVRHVKLFISSSTLDISDEFSLAHFSIKIKKIQKLKKFEKVGKSSKVVIYGLFLGILVIPSHYPIIHSVFGTFHITHILFIVFLVAYISGYSVFVVNISLVNYS